MTGAAPGYPAARRSGTYSVREGL
ncbi:hypothetical protein BRAO375_2020005 [Bradyrhizobium sp. ORS 375]|nr:hypothetical protein BRAO375_2020005 [Bradyrhizobium sp. ORS 375]